jgi:hypothetical protein
MVPIYLGYLSIALPLQLKMIKMQNMVTAHPQQNFFSVFWNKMQEYHGEAW